MSEKKRSANCPKVIGIIGDDDGSVRRAIEELESRESLPRGAVLLTNVTPQSLGMGAHRAGEERDFLEGHDPWDWRPHP